eukprot:CAMPEP_0201587258 /NCGR_PEP_ID=MMETSP0190_2-20130828/141956_1 /ASSEMBLY_ACC=CAM_ASM_000263 /TAXON_ID=37353 /ORGANISM="Rosalina sp." /LENGTH=101 /DNA_ID=CAMNT_0048036943 /DNA_START=6 /DNA_END=307 /DNA_ORIENTATION=+
MLSKPSTLSRHLFNRYTSKQNFSTLKATRTRHANSIVNQIYQPQSKSLPTLNVTPIESNTTYSDIHDQFEWDDALINESLNKHCLMAWGATDPMLAGAAKV